MEEKRGRNSGESGGPGYILAPNERFLSAYLSEKKVLGAKTAVITSTRSKLRKFLDFLDEHDYSLLDLSYEVAVQYQKSLAECRMEDGGSYKPNTIINLIGQASSFASWLAGRKLILGNPFSRLRKPHQEKKLPRDLPDEDKLAGYLSHLSRFDEEISFKRRLRRYRTHILSEFLYASGLRIAEASALRISDLDLEGMRLVVRESKGGRPRVALIGSYVSRLLQIYIHRIHPLLIVQDRRLDSSKLFLNSLNTLRKKFNEDLGKAREGREEEYPSLRSHDLRHSLGYHLLRAGCPLRYIQQILGHAHIGTSEIYTKVDGRGLSKMLASSHPRGKIKAN